jgi:ParB-like chromosome segregation protein Spo0J
MKIPIKSIVIGTRQREHTDMTHAADMADSMKRLGQIHNIGVKPLEDGTVQLIYGMHRLTAAKLLGWTEIEATIRVDLDEAMEQELELEEDVKRLDRTWQEKCLAMAKLYRLKQRAARAKGETFTTWDMAAYTGFGQTTVSNYIYKVAEYLENRKDTELWACDNYQAALQVIRARQQKEVEQEMERRRQALIALKPAIDFVKQTRNFIPSLPPDLANKTPAERAAYYVQRNEEHLARMAAGMSAQPQLELLSNPNMDEFDAPAKPFPVLTLRQRADAYNKQYENWTPPNTPITYFNKDQREFIQAFWFVGGGNISDLYGAYQVAYLERITSLFPDAVKVVHLFTGSLPPSEKYVRVGLAQGDTKPDIECDAHEISSVLPARLGKVHVIYADPPYSVEDSEHYTNSMINRERVLQECALCLEDGGFVVWLDQALPVFSGQTLQLVGAIGYIRSTGNRFRMVSIFRKVAICLI